MAALGRLSIIRKDGSRGDNPFPITQHQLLFGRDFECAIRIQLHGVLPRHAAITFDDTAPSVPPHAWLENYGPDGSVTVLTVEKASDEGDLIASIGEHGRHLLGHGDVVTVAGRSFVFEYDKAPAATETVVESAAPSASIATVTAEATVDAVSDVMEAVVTTATTSILLATNSAASRSITPVSVAAMAPTEECLLFSPRKTPVSAAKQPVLVPVPAPDILSPRKSVQRRAAAAMTDPRKMASEMNSGGNDAKSKSVPASPTPLTAAVSPSKWQIKSPTRRGSLFAEKHGVDDNNDNNLSVPKMASLISEAEPEEVPKMASKMASFKSPTAFGEAPAVATDTPKTSAIMRNLDLFAKNAKPHPAGVVMKASVGESGKAASKLRTPTRTLAEKKVVAQSATRPVNKRLLAVDAAVPKRRQTLTPGRRSGTSKTSGAMDTIQSPRKSVSFGPALSPEIFDGERPPAEPVRRGTPTRALQQSADIDMDGVGNDQATVSQVRQSDPGLLKGLLKRQNERQSSSEDSAQDFGSDLQTPRRQDDWMLTTSDNLAGVDQLMATPTPLLQMVDAKNADDAKCDTDDTEDVEELIADEIPSKKSPVRARRAPATSGRYSLAAATRSAPRGSINADNDVDVGHLAHLVSPPRRQRRSGGRRATAPIAMPPLAPADSEPDDDSMTGKSIAVTAEAKSPKEKLALEMESQTTISQAGTPQSKLSEGFDLQKSTPVPNSVEKFNISHVIPQMSTPQATTVFHAETPEFNSSSQTAKTPMSSAETLHDIVAQAEKTPCKSSPLKHLPIVETFSALAEKTPCKSSPPKNDFATPSDMLMDAGIAETEDISGSLTMATKKNDDITGYTPAEQYLSALRQLFKSPKSQPETLYDGLAALMKTPLVASLQAAQKSDMDDIVDTVNDTNEENVVTTTRRQSTVLTSSAHDGDQSISAISTTTTVTTTVMDVEADGEDAVVGQVGGVASFPSPPSIGHRHRHAPTVGDENLPPVQMSPSQEHVRRLAALKADNDDMSTNAPGDEAGTFHAAEEMAVRDDDAQIPAKPKRGRKAAASVAATAVDMASSSEKSGKRTAKTVENDVDTTVSASRPRRGVRSAPVAEEKSVDTPDSAAVTVTRSGRRTKKVEAEVPDISVAHSTRRGRSQNTEETVVADNVDAEQVDEPVSRGRASRKAATNDAEKPVARRGRPSKKEAPAEVAEPIAEQAAHQARPTRRAGAKEKVVEIVQSTEAPTAPSRSTRGRKAKKAADAQTDEDKEVVAASFSTARTRRTATQNKKEKTATEEEPAARPKQKIAATRKKAASAKAATVSKVEEEKVTVGKTRAKKRAAAAAETAPPAKRSLRSRA